MQSEKFFLQNYKTTPLRVIEYIIAACTVIGGLSLLTPLVVIPFGSTNPVVGLILSSPGLIAISVVAVIAGASHLFGLIKNHHHYRTWGLFFNALVRLYAIIASYLIAMPVLPFAGSAIVLYIVVILWFYHRLYDKKAPVYAS